jgi:LuxR family maltose regulon positive regulatory protein
VENPVVHEQVAFVIERMPATLRLVIATRSDPHLPLARLRASGELLEIRTGDLRFLAEEAEHLLTDVLGLNLTEPEVRLLFHRTEGWAAGLYLAALSLAGHSDSAAFLRTFAGDNRHIVDYLIAEVLDGQPPQRRSFLLRTSVLRRLGGALCDAVLQSTGSAAILAEIERENLFLTSLDDSRHWYRYHQLFAELLRVQLQYIEPERITTLHQRAATWFTTQGFTDDAVHHLSAAGDTAGLANLVAAQWAAEFNRGRLSTISGWIDLLPYESVSADPRLSVARAWIAVNFGHLDTAGSWIETTEAALASDPAHGDVIGAEFEVLRAVYDFKVGNVESALRRARAAITDDVSNVPLGRPGAYCIYGSALYFSGGIREAQTAYQRASRLAEEVSDHRARVYALGYLAVIAAEDDRLAEAEAFVARATGNSRDFAPGEHFVGVMVSLLAAAIIADRRGDMSAAREAADMAVVSARQGAGILELAKALVVYADILDRAGDAAAGGASRQEAAAALRGLSDAGLAQRLLTPTARHTQRSGQVAPVPGEQLTGKELEVLRLLATRLSRREIGDRLYVSINTVKSHQRAVYRKLDVDSRAAAVRRAGQLGLL